MKYYRTVPNSQLSEEGITVNPGQDSIYELII